MSTLPHDASSAAAGEHQIPVVPVTPYDALVAEAVSEFESGAEWLGVSRPPTAELLDLCQKVVAFTVELFPAEMSIKVRNDPEITDDLYFVFDVNTSGTVDEIVAQFDEWHRRLRPAVGRRSELFRLSI
jgi:hypothetical protein